MKLKHATHRSGPSAHSRRAGVVMLLLLAAGCSDLPTAAAPGGESESPQEGRKPHPRRAAAATVLVTPAELTLHPGAQARLQATVRDSSGATMSSAEITWSTSNPAIVKVDGSGGIAGVAAGTAIVTATSGTARGTSVVSVEATAPPASENPFRGAVFYVDPHSNAHRTADGWRSTRPADAAAMDRIAAAAQADWFGGWSGDIQSAVAARTTTITSAGALPVFVAYNIPQRDCGSYSAGGAASADAYRAWIRGFAQGIGERRAVVILEPDALAGIGCLDTTDRDRRLALLREAVQTLKAQRGVSVYLDAGHSSWISAAEMAERLRLAGIEQADGFALNVSNFHTTASNALYGEQLSARVGGKHFVIDTSRNGLGSNGEWCNPSGRALGATPTASTGHALVDAFLWIKRPGESDGSCNGGPVAGAWWPEYALGLAQRAGSASYAGL